MKILPAADRENMEPVIRKAEMGDLRTLDMLQNKIGSHERPLDRNVRRRGRIRYYPLEEFVRLIGSEDAIVLIAESRGKPIGSGLGEIVPNKAEWSRYTHKGNIGMMFVEKGYRERGVGGAILKEILSWFKIRGIRDIRLQVYANNDKAVRFYREFGFNDYLLELAYRPQGRR